MSKLRPIQRKYFDFSFRTDAIKLDRRIRYTYILKSSNDPNLYKIGRTQDLSMRLFALRSKSLYKSKDLRPFAFLPCDAERQILSALSISGVEKYYSTANRYPEAYYIRTNDINYIVEHYGFTRLVGNKVPAFIDISEVKHYNGYRLESVEYKPEIEWVDISNKL